MKNRKKGIYNRKWEKDNYQSISVLVLMGIHNLLTTMEAKQCITIIIPHQLIVTHHQVIIHTQAFLPPHLVMFQFLLVPITVKLHTLPVV